MVAACRFEPMELFVVSIKSGVAKRVASDNTSSELNDVTYELTDVTYDGESAVQ